MDIEELKKDKADLEKRLQQAQSNFQQAQVRVWRYEGALSYVMDNIKKEEVEDDRATDNEG